jgi:tRNA (cytidine/uridine-2'-O-)-methyltransferase
LYQPDIPQNAGTILRLGACLGIAVDVIRPAGFELSDRALRRAGLDYLDHAALTLHESWEAFQTWRLSQSPQPRVVLLSARADIPYTSFTFSPDDILLAGRESAGVPDAVQAAADARLCIPLRPGMRSLNVAVAVAMVLGEALRQCGGASLGTNVG